MTYRKRTILAISPSGIHNPSTFNEGLHLIRSWGHSVILSPNYDAKHLYTAGDSSTRGQDVEWALNHPTGDVIWFIRGGYGTAQILNLIKTVPTKDIIGFSDATALLNHIWNLGGKNAFHGPVLNSLSNCSDKTKLILKNWLDRIPTPELPGEYLLGPRTPITAPVVGGNLCVIASLCGTPYQLIATDCILALEDVSEPLYKLDRMILQLELSGVMDGVKGILLGSFSNCNPPKNSTYSLIDVFNERLGDLGIPVYNKAPFGHNETNWTWEQGKIITLSNPRSV